MKLVIDHHWATLYGPYPEKVVDSVTAYRPHGYWFSPGYRKGFWDGYYRFAKKLGTGEPGCRFPTGFFQWVVEALTKVGYVVDIDDRRVYESVQPNYVLHDNKVGAIRLDVGKYDYQAPAVQACLTHGRGIIWVATGGGKTEIAASVFNSIGQEGLFLTHRLNLAHQTRKRFEERLQRKIGILCGEEWDIQPITVAMVQSLYQNDHPPIVEFLKRVKVVIGDEIHHLESSQWYDNFSKLDAPWRFGLTATPSFDGPGMGLVGMCGPIIYKIGAQELIDRKVIVQPRIWFYKFEDVPMDSKTPWQTAYANGIVANPRRNAALVRIARQFKIDGKCCITLVKRINHGDLLADMMTMAGISCKFISGKTANADREKWMGDLCAGRLDHIIAVVEIMGEGADYPWLKAVINATGSKGGLRMHEGEETGRQTVQVLGRTIRQFEGKSFADYVDVADFHHKSFKEASLARAETLEQQGYMRFVRYWHEYTATP